MESITKFLDPKAVPEVTGDDLDVDKELSKSDLADDSDTIEVNVSKEKEAKPKVSSVVLPGKKESDTETETDKAEETSSEETSEESSESSSESGEEQEKSDEGSKDESSEDTSKDEKTSDVKDTETKKEEKPAEEPKEAGDDTKETAETESVKEDTEETDNVVNAEPDGETTDTTPVEQEKDTASEVDHGESDLDVDTQQPAPLLKLVEEYEYNNSKVYETPSGAKIVYVNKPSELCFASFKFQVGSFYEDDTNRGISHLLEHLMFNGCPGMSSREFAEKMDKLGMNINAYTSREETCYHFSGLKSNFITAFDLYATLIRSFTATQESLDKERGIVINEIGVQNDNNWNVLSETVFAQAFRQHPIAHPVIGYENVIENISLEQVKDWYETNYNVKNLTVYLVGDFPEEDLVFVAGKVQMFRDGIKNIDPVITDAMVIPMYKNVITHKEGATQTLIESRLIFKNEAFNLYETTILAEVLGGTMSSYLWNAFREERSIAYQVGAYEASMDRDHIDLHLYAGLNDPEDAELAKSLFKEAFTYAKAITEDDFNKGLNIVLSSLLSREETEVGMLNILRDALYMKVNPDEYMSAFKNLTYASYQSFVEFIEPDNMVTGILYPMAT